MNSEYIREVTQQLSLPQGRRVGQPGHEIAKTYLLEQMAKFNLEPFRENTRLELTYSREKQDFSNLIGVIRGQNPSLPPILVGAHYDSVIDAPCSDDNATAVAVTLAIADSVPKHSLQRDVVIAIFDSEEPPYFLSESMGSTRFYNDHCKGFDFAAAIIMDLIGHNFELSNLQLRPLFPNIHKLLAVTGCESQPILPAIVANASEAVPELSVVPTLNEYVGDMSDHHVFRLAGVPYLFLSCGQGKYYHTRHDNLDWINFEKVTAVARFVQKLVEGIDRQSTPTSHRASVHDPYLFEIDRIERALGPNLSVALSAMGLPRTLSTRQQLGHLIATLHPGLR